MARKFVRNITGTKLKGKNKEPLKTNMQNDLLSDDEDVYIRNKDEYHCLTDNLKELTTSTPGIVTIKNGKNSANIDVKNGTNIDVEETKIESESDRLIIKNPKPNNFKINIDLTDIENIIDKGDGEFPEIDLSNYALRKDLNNHIKDLNNPHKVNLKDLGIENLPETVTKIENQINDMDLPETKIESENERLIIKNPEPNNFKINIDLTDIENIIDKGDGEFPEIDLSNYALRKDLNSHVNDKENPHNVTKKSIGLEKVQNLLPSELRTYRTVYDYPVNGIFDITPSRGANFQILVVKNGKDIIIDKFKSSNDSKLLLIIANPYNTDVLFSVNNDYIITPNTMPEKIEKKSTYLFEVIKLTPTVDHPDGGFIHPTIQMMEYKGKTNLE